MPSAMPPPLAPLPPHPALGLPLSVPNPSPQLDAAPLAPPAAQLAQPAPIDALPAAQREEQRHDEDPAIAVNRAAPGTREHEHDVDGPSVLTPPQIDVAARIDARAQADAGEPASAAQATATQTGEPASAAQATATQTGEPASAAQVTATQTGEPASAMEAQQTARAILQSVPPQHDAPLPSDAQRAWCTLNTCSPMWAEQMSPRDDFVWLRAAELPSATVAPARARQSNAHTATAADVSPQPLTSLASVAALEHSVTAAHVAAPAEAHVAAATMRRPSTPEVATAKPELSPIPAAPKPVAEPAWSVSSDEAAAPASSAAKSSPPVAAEHVVGVTHSPLTGATAHAATLHAAAQALAALPFKPSGAAEAAASGGDSADASDETVSAVHPLHLRVQADGMCAAPPVLVTPRWVWRVQQAVLALVSLVVLLKLPLLRCMRREFGVHGRASDWVVFTADAVQAFVVSAAPSLIASNSFTLP